MVALSKGQCDEWGGVIPKLNVVKQFFIVKTKCFHHKNLFSSFEEVI